VPVSGGFSAAGLWTVEGRRGRKAFVKAATTDDTAGFLRDEMLVYGHLRAPFLAGIVGWDDDGHRPILILEDLSGAHWPPPWEAHHIDAVLSVCNAISATPPPAELERGAESALNARYWEGIAADPRRFDRLHVAAPVWREHAISALVASDAKADLSGGQLVHADVRSDNTCIADRVVVVDWNWAFRGNGEFDVIGWLPSLHLEGGPPPWRIIDADTSLVVRLAGFFLDHATRPQPAQVRSDLRAFQRAQGEVALRWAARLLDLPAP
jgi:hypothetical protein